MSSVNFRPGETLTASKLNEAFSLIESIANTAVASSEELYNRVVTLVDTLDDADIELVKTLAPVVTALNASLMQKADTSSVYTKDQTDAVVASIIRTALSDYATVDTLNQAVSSVQIDLTPYATKSYVALAIAAIDNSSYATKAYVNSVISNIDLSSYVTVSAFNAAISSFATVAYVDTAIANASISGGGGATIDLTPYALKTYVDAAISAIDLSSYATSSYVASAIAALDISSYATQAYVTAALSNIDLTDYATKAYVDAAVNIDLTAYATKEYVDSAISDCGVDIDLSDYATKSYVDDAVVNASVSIDGDTIKEYIDSVISALPVSTDDIFTIRTVPFEGWSFKGLGAVDWDITPIFQILNETDNSNGVPTIYVIDYEHETSDSAQALMQNCEAIPGAPMKFYCRCGESSNDYTLHLYDLITVSYTYGDSVEQSITIDPTQYFPEDLLNSSEWVDPNDAIFPGDTYSDDELDAVIPDEYTDYATASAFYTTLAEEHTYAKYFDAIELMGNSLTVYKRHYRDTRSFWKWPASKLVFDYFVDKVSDISAGFGSKNISCGRVRNIHAIYAPDDVKYTVLDILDVSEYSSENAAVAAAQSMVTTEHSCVIVSTPNGWHIVGKRASTDGNVTFMLLFDIPAAMTVVLPPGQGLYSNGSYVAVSTGGFNYYNESATRLDVLYRRKAITGESSLYDYYKHPFRAGLPTQSDS